MSLDLMIGWWERGNAQKLHTIFSVTIKTNVRNVFVEEFKHEPGKLSPPFLRCCKIIVVKLNAER